MRFPRSSRSSRRAMLARTAAALALGVIGAVPAFAAGPTLLNVSYDVAREFFKDINPAFQKTWKQQTGEDVKVDQSHGGSSKQARAVLDGLEADVVTMNQSSDIDVLASRGKLIPDDWARRLPNNSAPTTSVTVILVRKGNPKAIHDWADLGKPGTSVVIPNPKITGNGRYTYVAAWGSVLKAGGTAADARALVQKIFANVPVFDGGGRAATTTFAQRAIGDALCTFESEVNLIRITVTEVVGAELLGSRLAQSSGISLPREASTSISLDWFMVTTSASRPSSTARACLLEPPCDWSTFTSSPVCCSHVFWNAGLMSLKNSRATS